MKLTRIDLREMILKEQAKVQTSSGPDINKQLAIESLKTVLYDLKNVPDQNFDRYIQYLINYKIPTIIRTLKE